MVLRLILLSSFLLTLLINTSYATSLAFQPASKIFSINKHFFIDYDPHQSEQKVYSNDKKPIYRWQFSYPIQVDDTLFISDNGKYAFILRSKFVKVDDLNKPAIIIINYQHENKEYSYLQLTKPRKYFIDEVGPIGEIWRIWREKVNINNNKLTINTTDCHTLIINMATGIINK